MRAIQAHEPNSTDHNPYRPLRLDAPAIPPWRSGGRGREAWTRAAGTPQSPGPAGPWRRVPPAGRADLAVPAHGWTGSAFTAAPSTSVSRPTSTTTEPGLSPEVISAVFPSSTPAVTGVRWACPPVTV